MSGVIIEPFTSIESAERNFSRLNEAIVALQGGSVAIENVQGYENLATKQDLQTVSDRQDITDSALMKAVPVGTIFPYSGATAPAGFLWLESSTVHQKLDYPDLYTLIASAAPSLIIDSNSFKLADSRGNFMRGHDPGKVRDTDGGNRELLAQQNDAIRNIKGEAQIAAEYFEAVYTGPFTTASTGSRNDGTGWGGTRLYFDASRQVPTGSDNRPYNLSVLFIVKAKNELIT